MKKIIFILSAISVAFASAAQVFPVVNMSVNGDPSNRINLVMLPDGFTSAELPVFQLTADTIRKNLFLQTPLKEYAAFFNTYSISVPSAESGADHPANATDVTEPVIPVSAVNTYFNATFDGYGTHRALVCDDPTVQNVLAVNYPAYDIALLISNSFEYGGTGGPVATVSRNTSSIEVARHEIGHSFAGLADEYWAGTVFAMEKPNMTAQTDTAIVKWHNWLNTGGIGHFKYGNTSDDSLWYRPHQNCKMNYLNRPFCSVCQETFIDKIYSLVTPVDSLWPANTTTIPHNSGIPLTFGVKLVKPNPNTLKVKWQLNGADLSFTDTSVEISNALLAGGTNTLTAYITDTTKLSRSFRPASGYVFPVIWQISQTATGLININKGESHERFFYKLYPLPVTGDLTMAYDNQTKDENVRYSITDMSGRIIRNDSIRLQHGKQSMRISTAGMIPGNYILTLHGQSVYMSEQIVVE